MSYENYRKTLFSYISYKWCVLLYRKKYHYLTSDIAFDIIWLDGWLSYHVFRSIQQRFSNQKRNTYLNFRISFSFAACTLSIVLCDPFVSLPSLFKLIP